MYALVAIGECLIDFTPAGINEMGMQLFSRNPGGAPANVLAIYAKLGGKPPVAALCLPIALKPWTPPVLAMPF